ncbi:hypothetical protein NC99_18650 [Sunxiuqinia dokdonensis]|uniref:Uncharacterized protein n=1 Tax=Sunxiuqinia dokdonensis TaxID=1409788 RepID=A0A0L8VAY8_9BACT|nr:hypothetical protein NC99_18650 [Sunxiuqinia dokdonensis]
MSLNNNADGRKQQRARLDRDLFFQRTKPDEQMPTRAHKPGSRSLSIIESFG